jgi:hypothetical protein
MMYSRAREIIINIEYYFTAAFTIVIVARAGGGRGKRFKRLHIGARENAVFLVYLSFTYILLYNAHSRHIPFSEVV